MRTTGVRDPAIAASPVRILVCGLNYAPELTGVGKYTAEVAEFLEVSAGAEPVTREVGGNMQIVQIENPDNDLFETRHRGTGGWIHRSYLAKK